MRRIGSGTALAELETRHAPVAPIHNSASAYESASQTRRAAEWRPPSGTANNIMLGALPIIRDRSRAAVRNDGYAKVAIEKQVTNIIGTGITPLSMVKDEALREAIHTAWAQWTDECDADGQCDFYGLQALATRSALEGGDSFTRMRPRLANDGLTVPLQLQVLEAEFCPTSFSQAVANGNTARAGIELDALGRRAAYYLYASRPELDDINYGDLRRVPGDAIAHLYEMLRPGQLRGVPQLATALVHLLELDKFDDAVLYRQQLANMFLAFVRTPAQTNETADIDPVTGVARDTNSPETLQFRPGILQYLDPGEEIEFSEPPDAGDAYPHFMRQQLVGISAASGVPYEVLTGDMRGVNDRTIRVVLNEFRRRVMAFQHQVIAFKWCRPIWRAWMDRAFLSDALPLPADYAINPEPYQRVLWQPQGWPYIHPVQDIEAEEKAMRIGVKSRSQVVSERGDSAAVIDAQQAADNARADALGLKYDSDSRYQRAAKPALNADGEAQQQSGAAA